MSRALDVAIIGAGPAGLAAGALVARAGLKVCVFDENTGPGGQIYRAITQPALTRRDLLGEDYWDCLLYTSPSPRDLSTSRMPSSA